MLSTDVCVFFCAGATGRVARRSVKVSAISAPPTPARAPSSTGSVGAAAGDFVGMPPGHVVQLPGLRGRGNSSETSLFQDGLAQLSDA